jgi:hypothetical protein
MQKQTGSNELLKIKFIVKNRNDGNNRIRAERPGKADLPEHKSNGRFCGQIND